MLDQPREAHLRQQRPARIDRLGDVEALGRRHLVAERGELPRRIVGEPCDLRIDRVIGEARHVEDAPATRRDVTYRLAPDHVHHRNDVVDRTRERPGHLEVEKDLRQAVLARHASARRLQADEVGVRRRPADRAAAVGAERDRAAAGGDQRDRAARRAARRQRRIPRVAGRAEHRVVGVALHRELGDVGLAEDHRACVAQLRDRQLVVLGDEAVERAAAPVRRASRAPAGCP